MGRNSVRRSNAIQPRRLWKLFVVILSLTIFSLVFVFLQIRNIKLADDVKKLEVSLNEMHKRNNLIQVEIDRRMKPRALSQKIAQFNLNLINVSELQAVEAHIPTYIRTSSTRALVQTEAPKP